MAIKNYYVVLGVHREESETGIRAAYLGLAKKLHPDRIGEHSTKAFQEIVEAYQALSDPEKRRSHNHLLDQEEDRRRQVGPRTEVRRDLELESLHWRKVSPRESYQPARLSFEDLYGRFLRDSRGKGVPRADWVKRLDFEVVLSAQEARRGGVISIDVPIFNPCLACGGSGRDWVFPCSDCQGLGLIEIETTVSIPFPPQVRSGTVIEVTPREIGTQHLRLHLVVD